MTIAEFVGRLSTEDDPVEVAASIRHLAETFDINDLDNYDEEEN